MLKRFFFAALLAFCLAVPAVLAETAAARDASPTIARILKRGKLRVGMSGNQPPLNAKSKTGEFIGMEVDLARVLARSMEVELEVVQKPFPELLPALVKGDVDVVMSGMTITMRRNREVAFVGPYFLSGKSILTKSKPLSQADEAEDIDRTDLKLVALEASTSQKFIESFAPNAKFTPVQDYDTGVQMVIDGKVDALVADYPICLLSVLRHGDAGLATLIQPLTIEPIGIALPPDDMLFLNLVQNYFGALTASGALEELQKRWFEDASWLAELP